MVSARPTTSTDAVPMVGGHRSRGRVPASPITVDAVLAALDERAVDGAHGPARQPTRAIAAAIVRQLPDTARQRLTATTLARWSVDAVRAVEAITTAADTPATSAADTGDPVPASISLREADGHSCLLIVTGDRPLLYSSVLRVLAEHDLVARWAAHPVVGTTHGAGGALQRIGPARTADRRVSILLIGLDPLSAAAGRALLPAIGTALRLVGRTAADDPAITAAIDALPGATGALLQALAADHVRILGLLDEPMPPNEPAAATGPATATPATAVGGHQLGIATELGAHPHWWPGDALAANRAALLAEPGIGLTASRSRHRAPINRADRFLVVSLIPDTGPTAGADVERLVHLLALPTDPPDAALLRQPVLAARIRHILHTEDLLDTSHDARAVIRTCTGLPLDLLLRLPERDLLPLVLALRGAEDEDRIHAQLRPGPGADADTVLIGLPGANWSTAAADRLLAAGRRLVPADDLEMEIASIRRRQVLVRLQVWGATPGEPGEALDLALRRALEQALRSWHDRARDLLAVPSATAEAAEVIARVLPRLPSSYTETVTPHDSLPELHLLRAALDTDPASIHLALRPAPAHGTDPGESGSHAWLSVAAGGGPVELSDFMPILESLGFQVIASEPHPLAPPGPGATLQRVALRAPTPITADGTSRITDAIDAAWRGHLELDALNELIVTAGIDHGDIGLLRAYRRLRRQLGTTYTPGYVDRALVANAVVVRSLVRLVHARFDPATHDADEEVAVRTRLAGELDAVVRLDHDRILRALAELVDATVRTNAFRPDAVAADTGEPYIALKIDPHRIAGLPAPLPHREIFVHSPRVEGVHLRAGPVARGGLRWSDREDDVRTEVLDLLRAQILKNAVIVPTGAKGGFVLTHPPADPDELRAEVRRQYVTFVRGLLDVTDDLDGDEVIGPPGVVRHDDADPYLVVAADRGTATLSDVANALAGDRGFWLDDAFASGGSNGYDHKALGVTARGAWVTTTRHFAELGIDVAVDPIRVIGIGDMSGDVFGNGLLRSRAVHLVGAFDHRHILLDPDPDPDAGFDERRRLFGLPASSWADFDPDRLGPDAMIVRRDAKTVELNDAVRALLQTDAAQLSPAELIQAMLRAPVDLLFAGGIGTYVKADGERHAELGDRANDELRIDAGDLRVRVIAEGANLALTPRARVEFARRGGHINQDAIDNAAGVATSDLEVNLKILFRLAMDDRVLDPADRDGLLRSLDDDVVGAALGVVDRQAAGISREVRRLPGRLAAVGLVLSDLETRHDLDREREVLPDGPELDRRDAATAGLTRPEVASIVGWVKRDLSEQLLATDVPDAPTMQPVLEAAFPTRLHERFRRQIDRHRLRRELIATGLANTVVDRMGAVFAPVLAADTRQPVTRVLAAFQAARLGLDADRWWAELDALELTHGPDRVRDLEPHVEQLLATWTRIGLLSNEPDTIALVTGWRHTRTVVTGESTTIGSEGSRRARDAHARWLIDDLVEPTLARRLADAPLLALVPDIAATAERLGSVPPAVVADTMVRVGERLGLDRLEQGLHRFTTGSHWARAQRLGLLDDLRRIRRRATRLALITDPADPAGGLAELFTARGDALTAAHGDVVAAVSATDAPLDATAVAVRRLIDALD